MTERTMWRLTRTAPADGYWNMAVDEAMLEAGAAGLIPPTLRLYAWQPPAVSLGYFQPLDERIDRAEIAARGFDLVRRPSGGRAILHKDELTYCVVVPETLVESGHSVMGSYRALSRGIEAGLAWLGLAAEMPARVGRSSRSSAGDQDDRPTRGGDNHPTRKNLPTVCFTASAGGDMVAGGRKIVGSAQTRRRGVIMQHGSVPIHMDPAEHLAVMPGEGRDAQSQARLMEKACGVADALGREVSFDEVGEALQRGFAERLGIAFEPGELTPWELERARELRDSKYLTQEWNEGRGERGEGRG